MQLHQLEYFKVVARLEHFTRAAEEIRITQPSLSRAIGRLEAELGTPLFDRQKRRVRLNQPGQVFLQWVERALDELDSGKREVQDLLGVERGVVTLGFLPSVGAQLLPKLLRDFRTEHPGVRFQLYQNPATRLSEQLVDGEVDLCISSPATQHETLAWSSLMTEPIFVAVPPEHKLAAYESIKLNAVAEETFISLKPGNGLRRVIDGFCHQAGFEPEVAFEGDDLATVRGLVAAGLGVALMPAAAWQGTSGLQPRSLGVTDPHCQRTLSIAYVKGRYLPPVAELFREFSIEYFARSEPGD